MIYGYARVSRARVKDGVKVNLDNQIRRLEDSGAERVFAEDISAAADKRQEFERLLNLTQDGDSIIVTRLDRFSRSLQHGAGVIDALTRKGVVLRVLDNGLDTSTAMGRGLAALVLVLAEMERELTRERYLDGLSDAAKVGRYPGRPPALSETMRAELMGKLRDGDYKSLSAMARHYGVSVPTVSRYRDMVLQERIEGGTGDEPL